MTNGKLSADAIAENVWLRIVARGAMVLAAAALPVAGFVAVRYMDALDAKSAAILVRIDSIDTTLAQGALAVERLHSIVKVEIQRNNEQDRRLEAHEKAINRTRFPYPARPD